MYAGPIEKIYGDIETQIIKNDEEMTIKAIRECDIEVDKDELIKALQYDRNQYEKGYNDALDKIRQEIEQIELVTCCSRGGIKQMALDIIDKYKE